MPDISDLGGLERDIVYNALRAIYRDTGVRSQDANLFWRPQPVAPGGRLALGEAGCLDGGTTLRSIAPHPDFRVFLTVDPKHGELSSAMR